MQHGKLRTDRCHLVYRQALQAHLQLLLQHLHHRKRNSHGASRINKKWEKVRQYEETRRMICQNDLKSFKGNLVDESVPEHRDASISSHKLLSEPRAKVVSGKHSILLISRRTEIATSFENQNHMGFLQKTLWYTRALSGTFWWFNNNYGSQRSYRRMRISKQSSVRCSGTRLGNTVETIIPMYKQKLLRKRKRAYNSSCSRRGKQKSIILTIP